MSDYRSQSTTPLREYCKNTMKIGVFCIYFPSCHMTKTGLGSRLGSVSSRRLARNIGNKSTRPASAIHSSYPVNGWSCVMPFSRNTERSVSAVARRDWMAPCLMSITSSHAPSFQNSRSAKTTFKSCAQGAIAARAHGMKPTGAVLTRTPGSICATF